jgi:hypothetical protein
MSQDAVTLSPRVAIRVSPCCLLLPPAARSSVASSAKSNVHTVPLRVLPPLPSPSCACATHRPQRTCVCVCVRACVCMCMCVHGSKGRRGTTSPRMPIKNMILAYFLYVFHKPARCHGNKTPSPSRICRHHAQTADRRMLAPKHLRAGLPLSSLSLCPSICRSDSIAVCVPHRLSAAQST